MSTLPADIGAREQALQTNESFIIQAPAGSGKTGLLIRRYLALLAQVHKPEEILAITFTRKATAEMRQRILNALAGIKQDGSPEDDPVMIELASAARANDARQEWHLTRNTRRLRVQTIDSFCNELVHRMPWSARFGGAPEIIEDASELYYQAAQHTLSYIEDKKNRKLADACSHLIELMNANFQDASKLLGDMLAKRDKWMRLMHGNTRHDVERNWQQTISQALERVDRLLDRQWKREAAELAGFAAENFCNERADNPNLSASPIEAWKDVGAFPAPDYSRIELWRGVVSMLLTRTGSVRAQVTKKEGFPTTEKPLKKRMMAFLENLKQNEGLRQQLSHISMMPDGKLSDDQWRSTESILTLLPLAAAELKLLFRERNVADYTELSQRAEFALGELEKPSDLALVFDHRLQHLLMDEFQDTSGGQLDLVAKLMEGWQPDDGRTVFFVGDPMQSIYRFREAEVANFLTVQSSGIAQVKPTSLALQVNFRSSHALVEWFNHSFKHVMPDENDMVSGAVRYSPAIGYQDSGSACTTSLHSSFFNNQDDRAEILEEQSLAIAELIKNTQESNPDQSIAVLGRTRSSLNYVAHALDQYQIQFQSIKLQKLGDRQAVQDLLQLTRALIQPADRTAWLSLMRMPWCGLTVDEISVLCEDNKNQALIEIWQDQGRLEKLSEDSRIRLARLTNGLKQGLGLRGHLPLWQNLEATWLTLGGPAAVDRFDLDDCQRFIDLVRGLEQEQVAVNADTLDSAIESLWAKPAMESNVQLLTIHGAKGLEFDTVILPNLERAPRAPERELIRFRNLPDRLLIAAKPSSVQGNDPLFDYLRELEKEQSKNEAARLLYVACTRAKKDLHLFGSVKADPDKGLGTPPVNSLLGLLWSVVESDFQRDFNDNKHNVTGEITEPLTTDYPLRRFPSGWNMPTLPASVESSAASFDLNTSRSEIEFDWANEVTRVCGIVIHQIFQYIDTIGWSKWKKNEITESDRQLWRNRLLEKGIPLHTIDDALAQITNAVENTKDDPSADWIFSSEHKDIRTEWPVTGLIGGRVMHQVIDRSFVDPEGVRWIIDFKSSRHDQPGDLDQFIDQEKSRYLATMERYRSIVTALENLPTKIALYYPVLRRFEVLSSID